MIRTHPNDPPLTVVEAARIARIAAVAMLRGGVLTAGQQNKIDRILDTARTRARKGNS